MEELGVHAKLCLLYDVPASPSGRSITTSFWQALDQYGTSLADLKYQTESHWFERLAGHPLSVPVAFLVPDMVREGQA